MKVRCSVSRSVVKANQMKIGQCGYIYKVEAGKVSDTLVLRHYGGLVCLSHPQIAWAADPPGFDIELLPIGTEITLTVEE